MTVSDTPAPGCRRVLIAGCGYVGSALAERLVGDGHRVWGLRRESGRLPPGVEPVIADLTTPGLKTRLPGGIEQAVFAAATGGGPEEAYERLFVDGLSRLIDALCDDRHRVRRLLLVSSTGVYGQRAGEWVDERSETLPGLASGRALLRAEGRAGAAPWSSSSVRFGGIYGPGRIRLIRSVRDRAGSLHVPSAPRYLNQIHRDDCVGVLRHLLALPGPAPVYLGCDDEPAPRLEVLGWIARRLGLPRPAVVDTTADPYAGEVRGNKRCRNALLRSSGYRFRYPTYREGYEAVIRDMEADRAL